MGPLIVVGLMGLALACAGTLIADGTAPTQATKMTEKEKDREGGLIIGFFLFFGVALAVFFGGAG